MNGQNRVALRYAHRKGERVGDLCFLGLAPVRGDGNRLLGSFLCDCGNISVFPLGRTLNGKARTHCGCKTDHSAAHRRHGMRGSPEYSSWKAMKGRCLDPGHKDYPRWGGSGVTVCPAWIESFEAFYEHIGRRPAGATLDRIDNRLGYKPGNVRWATAETQATNRADSWTVEIGGRLYPSLAAAAHVHGVTETTIVRWCDGYTDPRRAHLGPCPPKAGCRRWRTYGQDH